MDETIYIGIKQPSKTSNGNLNDEWKLGDDGFYHCDGKHFSLTEEQIQSDFKNGFLVKASDKNAVE